MKTVTWRFFEISPYCLEDWLSQIDVSPAEEHFSWNYLIILIFSSIVCLER